MIKQVDNIIQQVEVLLRGGANNSLIQDLVQLSQKLLLHFSSNNAIAEFERCNEKERTENLTLAVKLHNKARNLSSPSHAQIRAHMKAAAAWMLALYGGDKCKVLSVVITLLSKAGQEIVGFEGNSELALKCYEGSIRYWLNAKSINIHKEVSPIDLQDMRTAVFWSYLGIIEFYNRLGRSQEEIRKIVSSAKEESQTLNPRLKLTFAERLVALGRQVASSNTHTSSSSSSTTSSSASSSSTVNAIHYFNTAQQAIESALLPNLSGEQSDYGDVDGEGNSHLTLRKSAQVKKLQMDVQLSIAFLYMNAK